MLAKIKKTVSLLVTICMVFSMMPVLSLSVFAAAGDGTEEKPYQITTADELRGISGSAHYKLMNDIVLTEAWTPIDSFGGTLNGDGHTISGLNISSAEVRNGFIKVLDEGGTVKDLTVSGSVTCLNTGDCDKPTSKGTGGIVGYNAGTIEGCEFYGTVSQTQGYNMYVAGIAGYNVGTISDCKNYGDITATGTESSVYVGGITGSNQGAGGISNCVNHGVIFGSVPNDNIHVDNIFGSNPWDHSGAYVGGITGYTANDCKFTDCSNEGAAVGENANAGAVDLIRITNPTDVTISAPVSEDELPIRLPSSIVLETTGGDRVGTVAWDISSYDASAEDAEYSFSGTVTLPSKVTNENSISLTATIKVIVGEGIVIPPPEPEEYALYFTGGTLYKATVDSNGNITDKEAYTEQTEKWSGGQYSDAERART